GAVAVAVGLDHHAQGRAAAQLAGETRAVVADGRQVDPGLRPHRHAQLAARSPYSASRTSTRVTTPTRRPCSTTGSRLCLRLAIRWAACSTGASASTVTGSGVIMSRTL